MPDVPDRYRGDEILRTKAEAFYVCVSEISMRVGMLHKDVGSAEVVSAAVSKCNWTGVDAYFRSSETILRMQSNRPINSYPADADNALQARWKVAVETSLASDLAAKRLGL